MMKSPVVKHLKRYAERISLKDIAGILLGSFVMAIAIQAVLVPAHLLTSGVSGIAMILHFFTGLKVWVWYAILNVPIFIAGYRYISRRFAFYSLVGFLALTFFLGLTQNLNFHIDDVLLTSVLGGVLSGIGTGINLRSKGSTGGLDIISAILKRYWGYSFGATSLAFNMVIIAIFTVSSGLELALFTAISIFVSAKVLDAVEAGPSISKTALIVSKSYDDIAQTILENMHRGCTIMDGRGAYTGKQNKILMVTIGKNQLPRLKEIVFEIDPNAFMAINESIEVYGQGFKSSKADF
jgi:uncharacterized membrane-anchored protein YitT (DUF2179 family)